MQNYNAKSIEVLTGLDPVKKRPGMYTNTENPNHLIQEIIDNSVDEVLAGFASKINITLYEDNSIEVADDGRGMPVDIHPEHKMSGIELIMTKLHSGGKFSNKIILILAVFMELGYLLLMLYQLDLRQRLKEMVMFII